MNRSFFIGCTTATFLLLLTWLLSSALPPTNALASFPRGSLQNVTITGDMTPVVGKSAPLHAEYATTTTPITYTWSPTPANGQGTSDVTYIWATTGEKEVSVAVDDGEAVSNDSVTIDVVYPTVTLQGGPSTAMVGESVMFTATIDPIISPYNYLSFDFGDGSERYETSEVVNGNQFLTTHTYAEAGEFTASATFVSSAYGFYLTPEQGDVLSDKTTIVVEAAPPDDDEQLASIAIEGASTGNTRTTYPFTATVTLIDSTALTTTEPIVYTWDNSNEQITHQHNAVSDTISLTWESLGRKTITTTATLAQQTVTDTHTVDIGQAAFTLFLPVISNGEKKEPVVAPFSVETWGHRILDSSIAERTKELGPSWIRLQSMHWRTAQPTQTAPIDWTAFITLEQELAVANDLGLKPIVTIFHNPDWATIPYVDPTTGETRHAKCGPIKEEYFDEYAAFLKEVVARYSQPPYNVHHWELGNEPDADIRTYKLGQEIENFYGCWGNAEEPFYGGKHYGEMLKVAYPAIKEADPSAVVMNGGLLIEEPETTDPEKGKPELFFKGMLEAGAGESFDVLAFHTYPGIQGPRDFDSDINHFQWKEWGGITFGKIAFFEQTMQEYGVDKPLFLNETGFAYWETDKEPPTHFWPTQADQLVRQAVRAFSKGVELYSWYTVNDTGWYYTSLLEDDYTPHPVFDAYQALIDQTEGCESYQPTPITTYVESIEAYRFEKEDRVIDVLWSSDAQTDTLSLASSTFIAAYTRDGAPIAVQTEGDTVTFSVWVEPTYVHRHKEE